MSEPDDLFQAAVSILGDGQASDSYRAACYIAYYPPVKKGTKVITREVMTRRVVLRADGYSPSPDGDYRHALLYLRQAYRDVAASEPTLDDVGSMLLGVHAGMTAEELWDCMHGVPWPAEAALLTLGALRDPAVALALSTGDIGLDAPPEGSIHV